MSVSRAVMFFQSSRVWGCIDGVADVKAACAGPIAPVLMTAWTVAFISSLSHFPYTVEGRQW